MTNKKKFAGIPDTVWNAIIGAVVTVSLAYMAQRNQTAILETGAKAAVKVEEVKATVKATEEKQERAATEVKDALEKSTTSQEAKTDAILKTGEDVHTLVNSSFGALLKRHAESSRGKANLSKLRADIIEAELAEQMLREHDAKQKTVDDKDKPK